jgi:hypothetical protein
MVTSNYIIDETVTWLRMRAGFADAAAFRDIITRSQEANRLHLAWVRRGRPAGLFAVYRLPPEPRLRLLGGPQPPRVANAPG